jgi:hypothetical protein
LILEYSPECLVGKVVKDERERPGAPSGKMLGANRIESLQEGA